MTARPVQGTSEHLKDNKHEQGDDAGGDRDAADRSVYGILHGGEENGPNGQDGRCIMLSQYVTKIKPDCPAGAWTYGRAAKLLYSGRGRAASSRNQPS